MSQLYRITHTYNTKPYYDFIIVSESDPTEYAIYIHFMAEEWIDEAICCTCIGIADALIKFYNCRLPTEEELLQADEHIKYIDLYIEREIRCGPPYFKMMESTELPRQGLKEYFEAIEDDKDYKGNLSWQNLE